MNARHWIAVTGLTLVALLASGCSIEIARNTDGSLSIQATMTQESLQSEIDAALADPLIEDVAVDLQGDHIDVTVERHRLEGTQTDTLTFRLDLGVSAGALTASISDVRLNDQPINEDRVDVWNERIANRLSRAAQRHPNSTLQSVQIGDSEITLIWRVETARSRG